MKGSEIKELVIVKLEEKSAFLSSESSGPILSGGDNIDELKPVYSYIDAHLANAANEVLLVAPLHKLNPTAMKETDIEVIKNNDNTGRVMLPADFLRIYSFKMTDWIRPVRQAINPTNPLYDQQYNKYTRGNPHKPVVTIMLDDVNGDTYLGYYSSVSGEVGEFQYVAKYYEEAIYLDDIAEVIALNCAKKVYEIYGNTEMANTMQSELTAVLTNMQN